MDKLRLARYNVDMNTTISVTVSSDLSFAPIALGLSGGRDSMCLAYAFLRAGVDFFAVNFEHGIRGENSVSDTQFVKDWCEKNGVKCVCFSLDVPTYAKTHGLTVEQAGRELRYSHFDEMIKNGECSCVALAHHRDDLSETVLMRIFRGTGVKGLSPMAERSGGYIRPLINYSREVIDEYVKENSIPYVEDETNADARYTRNFVRQELKRIKKKFPSVDEAIARLSRNAAEAEEFIENSFPYCPELINGECRLDISKLTAAESIGKKLYVKKACEQLGVMQDVEERHFPLVFGLADAENGKSIELPHKLKVHKDGGYLVFTRGDDASLDEELPFSAESVEGIIRCERVLGYDSAAPSGTLFIDADKIPFGAVLRAPKPNDKIAKFGGGTKNLGDFLTDKKIPLRLRKGLTVCAAGGENDDREHEILFVLGVDISASVRVDANSKNVIKITEDIK